MSKSLVADQSMLRLSFTLVDRKLKRKSEIFHMPLEKLMANVLTKALHKEEFAGYVVCLDWGMFDVHGICANWEIVKNRVACMPQVPHQIKYDNGQ